MTYLISVFSVYTKLETLSRSTHAQPTLCPVRNRRSGHPSERWVLKMQYTRKPFYILKQTCLLISLQVYRSAILSFWHIVEITFPSVLRLLNYIPAWFVNFVITFLLYCYLYIIQLCIYQHFQEISISI